MPNQDHDDFTQKLGSVVDRAMDSLDFEGLNNTITDTIQDVFDELQVQADILADKKLYGRQTMSERGVQIGTGRTASERVRARRAPKPAQEGTQVARPTPRFIRKAPGSVSGTVMSVAGGIGTGIFGFTTLLVGGLKAAIPSFSLAGTVALVPLTLFLAGSAALLVVGRRTSKRVKRFENYKRIIGDRTFCNIDELAAGTGKTREYVLEDIRKMIQDKFFYNAHLDRMGTVLMLDEQSYKQYSDSLAAYDARVEEEKRFKVEQHQIHSEKEIKDPELVKALEEGNRYLKQIQAANAAIPGVEITEKLSRLENLISQIFEVLESKPDQLPKLRKFMNYYMPTTLKLVEAYRQLDNQNLQVENVQKSKAEIERTLDTINVAYEKLLDSFFEADRIDIKSDISVLENMLAQEGLTGGFGQQ